MHFTSMTIAAMVPFVLQAAALPSKAMPRELSGYGYATFYDDHACTQDAGEAVSMGNSGCLASEIGRNSIYVQPGDSDTGFGRSVSLVWSPGTDCDCQNDCAAIAYNGGNDYCMDLNGHQAAQSFRFIDQDCASNNC